MDDGEHLLLEFNNSHEVDDNKRKIIVGARLRCLEIDISHLPLNVEELKKFITESYDKRQWIVDSPIIKRGDSTKIGRYVRNPIYEKTRDMLKEIFDNGTIIIKKNFLRPGSIDEPLNIRDIGYDRCEVNKRYLGYKCDLFLFL